MPKALVRLCDITQANVTRSMTDHIDDRVQIHIQKTHFQHFNRSQGKRQNVWVWTLPATGKEKVAYSPQAYILWTLRIWNFHKNHLMQSPAKVNIPSQYPERWATHVYNIPSDLSPPGNAHPSFQQLKLLESSSWHIGSTCIFYPGLLLVSSGNPGE